MKQTIKFDGRRRMCDTETAKERASRVVGEFGDPAGFEEKLYRNRTGFWFMWGQGGPASPYATGPAITAVTEEHATRILAGDWE